MPSSLDPGRPHGPTHVTASVLKSAPTPSPSAADVGFNELKGPGQRPLTVGSAVRNAARAMDDAGIAGKA